MATQTGITVSGPNEPFTIVRDLPTPRPGPKQVLVKSLATAINPVDPMMQHSGALVTAWPAVLGCDAGGTVIRTGADCSKLKVGDGVFGCTRVGQNEYSTFQETFLMDEDLAFKRPDRLTAEPACTMGVGLLTAALAWFSGTDMSLPKPGVPSEEKDEWVIVIGGSGAVGQYGIQVARLCGYKVLASSSPSRASIPLSQGAAATFSHRDTLDEQLEKIRTATGGKFARVFDASANGYELAMKALVTVSTAKEKWFATVDDWSEMNTPASIHEYCVSLGLLGRSDELGKLVTHEVKRHIAALEPHVEAGNIRPLDYELVDGVGFEKVVEAVALLESGKAHKKVVVRIQDE